MRPLRSALRLTPLLRLAGLAATMVAASYCALVMVAIARAVWHQRPFDSGLLLANPIERDVLAVFLPLYAAVMLVEIVSNGWRASSLHRLVFASTPSSFSDLAYAALNFSGLGRILGIVAFFGAGVWIERRFSAGAGLNVAADWSLPLEIAILVLWSGFWGYWEHRFMHTTAMWPLHKCHHSAEEFTVLTAEREHPIEAALSNVSTILLPASLGFSLEALAILGLLQAIAGILHHSNVGWLVGLERVGLFSPSGHRVHHGVEARLHDRNFGDLLNIWDRLFGTYVRPPGNIATLPIGVEAPAGRHNTANPLREIVLLTADWFFAIGRMVRPTHGPSVPV